MIEQELLFLGLLKESPKHGYEIKLRVREIRSLFAGIELKSIYYPLGILLKKGLVAKKKAKYGRRPECFVYQLTAKGKKRFDELLNKSFLDFKRPQFSLDLSLYFLTFIHPAVARRRLRARMTLLKKLAKGIEELAKGLKKEKPASLAYICEHNFKMVESEYDFLRNLIAAF